MNKTKFDLNVILKKAEQKLRRQMKELLDEDGDIEKFMPYIKEGILIVPAYEDCSFAFGASMMTLAKKSVLGHDIEYILVKNVYDVVTEHSIHKPDEALEELITI